MREIEVRPCKQIVYAQPRICPGEWDAQTVLEFWDTNGSPNLDQTTRPYNNQQQKENLLDFAVPSDNRVKLKESEKNNKYRYIAWELKKTLEHESDDCTNCNWCSWCSHQRIGTGLEDLEIKWRVETIQTTALLRWARILRRVLETWGDLLFLILQWRTISERWWEKLS